MSKWMKPFPDKSKTGYFGKVRNFIGAPKNPHRGTDWGVKIKTPIPAITEGKIMLVQFSRILGWVIVQSAQDSAGKVFYIGYCHLHVKPSLKVAARVKCGDTVGLIGNSGSASSGPHLHATLSDSVRGVFWGNVFDLAKKIEEEEVAGNLEKLVDVTYTHKNGNVVVTIEGVPKGYEVRLRKDGKSVYTKTVKKAGEVLNKGVTLTSTHTLSVEVDGVEVYSKKLTTIPVPKVKVKPLPVEKTSSSTSPEAAKFFKAFKLKLKPVQAVIPEALKAPEPVAPVAPVVPEPVKVVAPEPVKVETPEAVRVAPGARAPYVVASGDTLGAIASRAGYNVAELVVHNNIANANLIQIGQVINFPPK